MHRLPALFLAGLLAACGTASDGPRPGTDSASVQEAAAPPAAASDTASSALAAAVDSVIGAASAQTVQAADTQSTPALPDPVTMSRSELQALLRAAAGGTRDTIVVRMDTASAAAPDTSAAEGVSSIPEGLRFLGARFFFALVVFVATFWALRILVWLIESLSERSARRRLLLKRLIPITRITAWGLAVYFVVANVFEVDRNGILAASAALGIGVGLAAQDVLKNILGGFIIILDQPFQVGDKVLVGGTYGEVVAIGLRSTRIRTHDDSLVSVPNSQVVDSQVSNSNSGALDCLVVTHLYLPGWTDVEKAKQIAYNAAANSRYVFLDKPIVVRVKDEFKETFLTHFLVKAYVLDTRYETALSSDITETAKIEFLKAGLLEPVYGLTAPPELMGTGARMDPQ